MAHTFPVTRASSVSIYHMVAGGGERWQQS